MDKIDQLVQRNRERAAGAYEHRLDEVQERLIRVQRLVKVHAGASLREGIHYGHVGDLAHVADELKGLERFLSGGEE